jgi:hypothetical protein
MIEFQASAVLADWQAGIGNVAQDTLMAQPAEIWYTLARVGDDRQGGRLATIISDDICQGRLCHARNTTGGEAPMALEPPQIRQKSFYLQ